MNKLTNTKVFTVARADGGRSNVARRPASRSVLSKGIVRPLVLVGKTAIFAVEIAEVIGFGLALL